MNGQRNKSDRIESIFEILLVIGLLCYVLAIFVTNLFHFNYRINADIASEAVLGRLIWESGQVFPDTWYASTEVRLIGTADVSAIFFGLCHNMVLAMGLACCFMTVMILLSVVCFLKTLGIKRKYRLLMEFMILMIPANFALLEISYLFAGYYAVHIIVLFYTLAVYGNCMKTEKMKWAGMFLCIILAFILGMQGARGILVIYGPLFGMGIIRKLYLIYSRQEKKKSELLLNIWTGLMLAVSFIGMCLPISAGQSFSKNIRNGLHKLFTVVVPDLVSAMGFEDAVPLGKICLLILLLAALYVLADILFRMVKKQAVSTEEWIYLVICSSPAVTALIVAFTTVESSARYYFILPFVMACGVMLLYIKCSIKIRAAVVMVVFLLSAANFSSIYLPVITADEPPVSDIAKTAEFLAERGYTRAYATFENANTITVLSEGKVQAASVNSVSGMDICKWLTSTDWYVPNVPFEETTAYVITEAEMDEFMQLLHEHEDVFRYLTKIGKYYIYSADYNFSNMGE